TKIRLGGCMSAFSPIRRAFVLFVFASLSILALALSVRTHQTQAAESFDTVIANGHIIDPKSGLDAVRYVGIRNGKIAAISAKPLTSKSTIDAKNLIIAPGFINPHEHGQDPRNYQFQARDRVTTSLELEGGTDQIAK